MNNDNEFYLLINGVYGSEVRLYLINLSNRSITTMMAEWLSLLVALQSYQDQSQDWAGLADGFCIGDTQRISNTKSVFSIIKNRGAFF